MAQKSLAAFTVILILIFALSVDASAQQGRGGGQRYQGGRGQGAQSNGVGQGCMAGLGLTQEQQREIVRIRQDTQQRVQVVRRDTRLTPAQRQQRITQIQREGHDRVIAVLTPQQRRQFQTCYESRYGQGRPGGAGAGPGRSRGTDVGQGVPGVQLSEEQRQEIAQIRERLRTRIQEVNRNPNLTQQQRTERVQDLREEAHDDIMDVLTPQQRQQFDDWWSRRQRGMQSTSRG